MSAKKMPVNRFDAERTATGWASGELSIQSRQRDCNEAEANKKPAMPNDELAPVVISTANHYGQQQI